MKKRSKGFTLIEMLLVIGLLIGMAALSTQSYIQDFKDKEIERDVIDMMTIANAAVAYTYSHGYKWPGEAAECGGLLGALQADGYFNAASLIGIEPPTCPPPGANQPHMLNVSYIYTSGAKPEDNEEMAVAMAGMLPSAEVSGATVNMKLLKPRGGLGAQIEVTDHIETFNITTTNQRRGVGIDKPSCPNAKLFVATNTFCGGGSRGIRGVRVIKDFFDPNVWQVYVEVEKYGGLTTGWYWDNIEDCDGHDIEFSYVRYCS